MLFGALPVLLCIQYEMNSGCFIFSYCIHRLHKLACRLLDENLKLFFVMQIISEFYLNGTFSQFYVI